MYWYFLQSSLQPYIIFFFGTNLKVFIEEACLLHHPKLLFLFVFPNEGELLGVGRTQLVVQGLQVPHLHLQRNGRHVAWVQPKMHKD